MRESLQNFDSAFDLLNEGEKKEFLRLMVRKVVVHPTEVEIEVYEGESFSAPVQGLKGTRGGKNVRLSPDDVNAGVSSKSAPEPQPGTKPGPKDPSLRARCDMAPRSAPDTNSRGRVIWLRGRWRGARPKTKRESARRVQRRPGERGMRWQQLLDERAYPSRAALARAEGASRAAVIQALARLGEGR